jgi:hypothetical protein
MNPCSPHTQRQEIQHLIHFFSNQVKSPYFFMQELAKAAIANHL